MPGEREAASGAAADTLPGQIGHGTFAHCPATRTNDGA